MIHPLPSRFEGHFYDGQSPLRVPAALELTSEGVRISPAGSPGQFWPGTQIRVAPGSAGEGLRLHSAEGPPGQRLIVADARFVEALEQYFPGLDHQKPWLERLPVEGWVAAACGGLLALTLVFSITGFRWLAEIAAGLTPVPIEERLGRNAADVLAPAAQRCSDPSRERDLSVIVDRLADAAASPYRFRVLYVRDARVNAFAAPGGYIVVYEGLLRRAETAEEFAGVLAHEMEHVLEQHGTRALARELPGRTLLSLASLNAAATPAARQEGAALINRQHRRSEEEEADRESIPLLARAKIETNGLARFLRRLHGALASFEQPYAGSHPATLERAALLDAQSRKYNVAAEALLSITDWENARMVCAAPAAPQGRDQTTR